MDIKKELLKILCSNKITDKYNNKKINDNTRIEDLGIDSLLLMDLVIEIEDKIGKQLDDSVLVELKNKTIGELIKELEKIVK